MFDIGFFELFFIAIVALVVLGPERMPHAVRMTGAWIAKARRSFMHAKIEIERQIQIEEFKQRVKEQEHQLNQSVEEITQDMNHGLPFQSDDTQHSTDNTHEHLETQTNPHPDHKKDSA